MTLRGFYLDDIFRFGYVDGGVINEIFSTFSDAFRSLEDLHQLMVMSNQVRVGEIKYYAQAEASLNMSAGGSAEAMMRLWGEVYDRVYSPLLYQMWMHSTGARQHDRRFTMIDHLNVLDLTGDDRRILYDLAERYCEWRFGKGIQETYRLATTLWALADRKVAKYTTLSDQLEEWCRLFFVGFQSQNYNVVYQLAGIFSDFSIDPAYFDWIMRFHFTTVISFGSNVKKEVTKKRKLERKPYITADPAKLYIRKNSKDPVMRDFGNLMGEIMSALRFTKARLYTTYPIARITKKPERYPSTDTRKTFDSLIDLFEEVIVDARRRAGDHLYQDTLAFFEGTLLPGQWYDNVRDCIKRMFVLSFGDRRQVGPTMRMGIVLAKQPAPIINKV